MGEKRQMKNADIAVKPHEHPDEPMPWAPLFPQTSLNHRDRKRLITSRSSVVVAGLCKATWGEDFRQHEVWEESHTKPSGHPRPYSGPSESCAAGNLNSEKKRALGHKFLWNSFTQPPICFTVCWLWWIMPQIKTPVHVLKRNTKG